MTSPSDALRSLLDASTVASLGTVDDGHPSVSLVPYALLRDPTRLVVLVSELSPHTAMLRRDPRCAWMVSESPNPADPRGNHALARVMAKATARFLTRDEARERGHEAAYRARFPIAETLLGLKDFHFVELSTVEGSASFVQGFGRAYTAHGPALETVEHVRGR